MRYKPPHPARLLRRFGVSEVLPAAAVAVLAALQYAFLAKLWEGYLLHWSGDAVHHHVIGAAAVLSAAGAVLIILLSLYRWHRSDSAARRLERSAAHLSFDGIRQTLAQVAARSSLQAPPELLYTPKDALALEVRDRGGGAPAVVIGLEQRTRHRLDPDAFAAQLGHEISHLETGTTRFEVGGRRLVALHFRILAWLVAVFALALGFIDPIGIASSSRFSGFDPVFSWPVYQRLTAQFVVLLLSSAIVFVYSYFFVVRCEHGHDVRGSQLAQTDALVDRVFVPLAAKETIASRVRDFFQLHPSASARAFVVRDRDIILISAILFPLIVAGIQPMLPLLTAGWREVIGVEQHWWNLGLTMGSGLILYLAISADLARLGLDAVLGRRGWTRIPIYAASAGLATQLPRLLLEIVYGLRRGTSTEVIIERIISGTLMGGGRIALMIALTLLLLTYLSAVWIAATGESGAGRMLQLHRFVSAVIAVAAVTISNLTSPTFMLPVLILIVIAVVLHLIWFVLTARCGGCVRARTGSLVLRTRCACGKEHLPQLRKMVHEPYERHVSPTG